MRLTRILRHSFAVTAFLGCAWLAWTQAKAPVTPSKLNKIADDLYELETAGGGLTSNGGNVAVYITSEGVILVDDKFDLNFPDIMASVKSVTDKPVKYVLSTHHHGDHTGSSARWLEQGAMIVAHRNNRALMEKNKQPGLPQITFNDEASVFLGGKEVRMKYFGRGHTGGDAVVYFPANKVVHTGDLFVNFAPLIDYNNGGTILDWPHTLEGALGLDFDTAIPGHGPISKKDDVRKFREKIMAMQNRIGSMSKAGSPDADILKMLAADYGFGDGTPQARFASNLIAAVKASK